MRFTALEKRKIVLDSQRDAKPKEIAMNISRILGLIILVIGIVCLVVGMNSSHSVVNEISSATTGRFTKQTMLYIFGGIAMLIGGGALFFGGRPRA